MAHRGAQVEHVAADEVHDHDERRGGHHEKRDADLLVAGEDARAAALQGIPARRFGNATEFGQLCAFVCSAQASYLVGQNILLDGGAYPGTY